MRKIEGCPISSTPQATRFLWPPESEPIMPSIQAMGFRGALGLPNEWRRRHR
jgi:hypothetical protein